MPSLHQILVNIFSINCLLFYFFSGVAASRHYHHSTYKQYHLSSFLSLSSSSSSLPQCENHTKAGNISSYKIELNFLNKRKQQQNCYTTTKAAANYCQNFDVSVTTQFTLNRYAALQQLARYWSGPIVAVLFGTVHDASELRKRTSAPNSIFSQRQQNNITTVFHHEQPHFAGDLGMSLYPTNILRNLASNPHNMCTAFNLVLDVDFLPRSGMYERLRALLPKLAAVDLERTALVVPSFEFLGKKWTQKNLRNLFPRNKTSLLDMWDNLHRVRIFNNNTLSHYQTNFPYWRNATQLYEITYEWSFEPTIVYKSMACARARDRARSHDEQQRLLEYDDKFVGYTNDKATLPARMAAAGYRFYVLPDEYVIHVPHPRSSAKYAWLRKHFKRCRCAQVARFAGELLTKAKREDNKKFAAAAGNWQWQRRCRHPK